MIDIQEMRKKVSEFEKKFAELQTRKEALEAKKQNYNKDQKDFENTYSAIIKGESTNPFINDEKTKKEAELNQTGMDIIEEQQLIESDTQNLNKEFDVYSIKLQKEIALEKQHINQEHDNSSIESLEGEKAKLQDERSHHYETINTWEENNINPDDAIYKHLKENKIPELDKKIADIDQNIANLQPDVLNKNYNTLENVQQALSRASKYTIQSKIEELAKVVGEEKENENQPKEELKDEEAPEVSSAHSVNELEDTTSQQVDKNKDDLSASIKEIEKNLNDSIDKLLADDENKKQNNQQSLVPVEDQKVGFFKKIFNKIKSVFSKKEKTENKVNTTHNKVDKKSIKDEVKLSGKYGELSSRLQQAKTAEETKKILDDAKKATVSKGISSAEYSGLLYNAQSYGLINSTNITDLNKKENYNTLNNNKTSVESKNNQIQDKNER